MQVTTRSTKGRAWLRRIIRFAVPCLSYCCSCTSFASLDDTLKVTPAAAGGASGAAGSSGAAGGGGRTSSLGSRPAGVAGTASGELLDASAAAAGGTVSMVGDGSAGPDAAEAGSVTPVRDAAPEVPPCVVGSALSLDGASSAVIDRPVQDDFTFEAWIRTTVSLSGVAYYQGRGVFDADVIGGGAVDDFAMTILNDSFVMGTGNPDVTLEGTSVVTSGEWVHVAGTRRASNGQMQIVVNGVLEASDVSGNTGSLDESATVALGGATPTRQFIGELDEVRVWDVVRTPQEIGANMRRILTGDEPGLLRYYRFEDTAGASAADTSSFNAPAALVGTPGFAPSTALCSAP